MNDLSQLYELVQTHHIKQALIIDDAYDTVPFAEDLLLASIDGVANVLYDRVSGPIRKILGAILEAKAYEPDDYATGLSDDEFVEKVWQLAKSGRIAKAVAKEIFGAFEANQVSKNVRRRHP